MAQVDPANFYMSSDPNEVLDAYYHIVGKKDEPGITKGKVAVHATKAIMLGIPGDNELQDKELPGLNGEWGHVEVRQYVHPAMVPLIAKTLGWKKEEVWAIAQFEAGYAWDEIIQLEEPDEAFAGYSGPEILYRELGTTDPLSRLASRGLRNTDLIFSKVPVPPSPMRTRTPSNATSPMGGSVNLSLEAISYYSRLYEFAQGKEDNRVIDYYIQRYFNALSLAMVNGSEISFMDLIQNPNPEEIEWEDGSSDQVENTSESRPQAIHWMGESRVLVQDGPTLKVYNLETETMEASHEVPEFQFLGMDPECRLAIFNTYSGFGQFELAAGKWRIGFQPGVDYVFQSDQIDAGMLIDHRAGKFLRLWRLPDYPVVEAYSRDRRYLWMLDKEGSGGIFDLKTGMPVHSGRGDFDEEETGVIDAMGEEEVEYGAGNALALYDGKWLMFISNTLFYDGKPVFRLGWEVRAACFDESGSMLIAAGSEKICTVALGKALRSGNFEDFEYAVHNW